MNFREIETLGKPDLQIGGMKIWVHGRQFPDATDYWDGNWLRVTAYCVYPDSMVRTRGSILHLGELIGLVKGCIHMYETLSGEALLECIEPNLAAKLKIQWNGAVNVHLEITPDHMTESHSFDDSIDQSHLPKIVRQCNSILAIYPIREPETPSSKNDA